MATTEAPSTTPAYISYTTFKNTIRTALTPGGAPLPPKLDRTMLKGSNSGKAQFWSALRFFDLIDPEDRPSKEMIALVTADDARWKAGIKALIERKYPAQLHELKSGTLGSFKGSFGDIGGAVVIGAMRFLRSAAEEVDLPISPRIGAIPSEKKVKRVKPETPPPTPNGNGASAVPAADAYKAAIFKKVVEELTELDTENADPADVVAQVRLWQGALRLIASVNV